MCKKICYGVLSLAGAVLLLSPAAANKNFVPDWTFKGSSLGQWRTLGSADWRAENGEIVGTPKTAEGGWLILDRALQDIQFAATFRCTGGCRAGVMLRTQSTPEGIQGAYLALPDGQNPAAAVALRLDLQGREVSREPLPRGMVSGRFATLPAASRQGGPAAAPPRRAGDARAGGPPRPGLPADSPLTRPDSTYRPNEWNPLEVILDANYLRAWVNDGPESGVASGIAGDEVATYGPVALYVGGSGEVRFKQVEIKDLGRRVRPKEQLSSRFRMQRINDFYYAWSATAADFNRDGIMDVAAGPFYYLGPDYQVSREFYPSQPSAVGREYTPAAVNFAYDYTGDGWPDIVVTDGRPMALYVNPKGELRRWDKYSVLPTASAEIAIFKDIDGDGKPDAVFSGRGGTVSWAAPDPAKPTEPWIVHQVSAQSYGTLGQHGIGAGDINGDGRTDIVSTFGWWEQPPKGTPEGPWPYHPVAFGRWPRSGGSPGGADMGVFDVNGDGLNDVVTSMEAHGWAVGWYEQKRDAGGAIAFVEHVVMNDLATKTSSNVSFSQPHATTLADIDGDGMPDLIVGKRVFSHLESYQDPDPYGPDVLYWFRIVRTPKAPGGAEFRPELIHNLSGAGSAIFAADLNKDGATDIVTSAIRGTFVFWGTPPAKRSAVK